MTEIIPRLLKASDNLAAECLLRLLPVWNGERPGTAARGLSIVREYLESLGIDPRAHRVADGSGLSHYNLVSPDLLVRVLGDMQRRTETRDLWREALPVAGTDGTLSGRMGRPPLVGRVFAKTGTLSSVSSLAGYATTPSGHAITFAIMIEGFPGPARPWRELQDRLLDLALASFRP